MGSGAKTLSWARADSFLAGALFQEMLGRACLAACVAWVATCQAVAMDLDAGRVVQLSPGEFSVPDSHVSPGGGNPQEMGDSPLENTLFKPDGTETSHEQAAG